MKSIKWVLLAFSALACLAFASCSMPSFGSGLGSGNGQNSASGGSITDDSSNSGTNSDNSGAGPNDTVGDENKPTDSSEGDKDSTGDVGGSGDSSSDDPIVIPDGVPEIPEGKIYVEVTFFTMVMPDGTQLQQGYFVDESATLNDFLDEYVDDMVTYLAEVEGGLGFGDQYGNGNGEEQLRNSFWQIAYYLIDGEDSLSGYFDVAGKAEEGGVYFPMIFTPSGAGPNVTIYDGWDDYDCTTFPFPIGVCLRDTIDWAYEHGFFEMSYTESIKVGTWRDYWSSDVTLEWDYCVMQEIVLDRSTIGEGGEQPPQETSFTVYMPMIYDFWQYEDGTWEIGSLKEPMQEFWGYPDGVMLRDAMSIAGVDPYMTWVCYVNGERVSEETILNEDCVVVCVAAEQDRAFDPFTVTVQVEGHKESSYTYAAPVSMWDCATRYCKEQGLDYATYVWTNESQSTAAISEYMLTVRDTNLYGSIYKEPEKPTEATVTIYRYDGEEETVQTYAVAYGCRFETFVQENFWSEYNDSNSHEYEYAFFGGGMGNEIGGYQELTGSYNVWMIKRSVLEQGYNVSVDLTTRDSISAKGERLMTYPATLRQLVYEVTGWDIYLDGYYVLVNGEDVSSSEKFDYIANFEEKLYYRDVTIVVKPIFEINVEVLTQDEQSKSKRLTYYGEVTPSQVALDLGLSRKAEDYLWKTGWSSDSTEYLYSVGESLMMRLQSGGYLFVEARKVLVNISMIIPTGEEMQFNTTSDMANNVGWEWSVSVQKAAGFALGDVVGGFDDYRWSVKGEDGVVRSVTGDTLLSAINKPYTGDVIELYTVYTLVAVPKQVQVRIVSYDTNGNELVLSEKECESGTTIGTLLSSLGFQKGSDNYTFVKDGKTYWMMVDLFSGYDPNISGGSFGWQTKIDRSIRITLNVYY